jgi:hypothetical protein
MVFYHCASIALLTAAFREFAETITTNIDFIARAFILLSGLLCGIHYLPQFRQSSKETRRRLAIRGLKLVTIFLLCNLIIYSINIFPSDSVLNDLKSGQILKFILDSPPKSLSSFVILYYIGIFLLITSLLIGKINFVYPLAAIFIINPISMLIMFGTYGFIGMVIGSFWVNNRLDYSWNYLLKFKGIPLILLFLIYVIFIHSWRWPFDTSILFISTLAYSLKIALFLLSLLFIIIMINSRMVINPIILLGKYTLVSYLGQILIIYYTYYLLSKYIHNFYYYYLCNIVITCIILYLSIYFLHYCRNKSGVLWVDKVYKFIFN